MDETRVIGKITKLSDRGWGFISSQQVEFTRIFFHWSALNQDTLNFKELKVGMKVEFGVIRARDRGYRATKIKVIEDEPKIEEPNNKDS